MIAEKVDCWTTVWSKRAGLFLFGWFASSAFHGTLTATKAEKALPAIQAEAGCEHWRANVTTKLALGTQMVNKAQIPGDCPHPKVDIPPVENPLPK